MEDFSKFKEGLQETQVTMFDEIIAYLKSPTKPWYVVSAPAGTGKTFTARRILQALPLMNLRAAVVTFTGRASLQLAKGGLTAQTIHSLLYKACLDDDGNINGWSKNEPYEVKKIVGDCIFIDEGSMVPKSIHDDLMAIGVPLIYLGDHDQLDPVEMNKNIHFNPMTTLVEQPLSLIGNMRFREDSGIGFIANRLRSENTIPRVKFDDLKVIPKSRAMTVDFHRKNQFDAVICGMNKTRKKLTKIIRDARGIESETPEVGEPVMCLRNDVVNFVSICNGELFTVEGKFPLGSGETSYYLRSVDDNKKTVNITIEDYVWETEKTNIPLSSDKKVGVFTFGYAGTAYKYQGSTVNRVLFIDENVSFFTDQRKFRYTACSRAAEWLTIAL